MPVPAARRITATVATSALLAAGATAVTQPASAAPDTPTSAQLAADNVVVQSGTNLVGRIDGTTRFLTAVEVSRTLFPDVDDIEPGLEDTAAGAVVLARADDFADGLSGVPLAVANNAPMLLTPTAALDADTRAEIERVLAPGGTVYVLGSAGAISTDVTDELTEAGFVVDRLEGADRYGTAVAVAEEISGSPDEIFVTTGADFADALSAGSAAAARGGVVVLSNHQALPTATQEYLDANPDATLVSVGGPAATATAAYDTTVDYIGGNRYETAALVAGLLHTGEGTQQDPELGPSGVVVASGENFPDALSGGVMAGLFGEPVLLARTASLPDATRGYLEKWNDDVAVAMIVGGPGVVDDAVAGRILGAIR